MSDQPASPTATPPAPPARPVHLVVNGVGTTLELEPRVSLLDALREHLHLTGTKKGCNQGACGACTVLVDGRRIVSCLALAVQYDGRAVTTIEGVGPHPLQDAFVSFDGLQCGFCTPGRSARPSACSPSTARVSRVPSPRTCRHPHRCPATRFGSG